MLAKMKDKSPVYDYYIRRICSVNVLCIVDKFDKKRPTMTVTGAIQDVLEEIIKKIGKLPGIVIYRDERGIWDKVKTTPDGEFSGFALISHTEARPTDEEQAVQLAAVGHSFM